MGFPCPSEGATPFSHTSVWPRTAQGQNFDFKPISLKIFLIVTPWPYQEPDKLKLDLKYSAPVPDNDIEALGIHTVYGISQLYIPPTRFHKSSLS